MSVVGFDFGNESCIMACIRGGRIEVLQNSSGKRKTSTCVGFSGNQRLLAGDGIASFNSNYKNSIVVMKRLLGRKANEKFFEEEKLYLTTKVSNEKNGMMVSVKYDSKARQFTPESLCAMQLSKLKNIVQKKLKMPVKDCVIGVPAYWNDQQRRAMLTSAKIAGLNVLRLMNESTAVALNYGILRPITSEKKVLFFDMGWSSLCLSLVSFDTGKLTVLARSSDHNLGGRDFDKVLMDYFRTYIKNKYKMDVFSQPKPTLKLRKECTRVKKILSANKKAMFNVEYIMNDTDVKGEITRDEFEKLSVALLERMISPLNQVLAAAGVQKSDLDSVEVVGGAVRIPMVKTKLGEWFDGKALSTTCDGDESVARGCALQCAMLAPFVKVKDFEINDVTTYGIQLYWQPYSADDKRPLAEIWSKDSKNTPVPALSPIPSFKSISFKDKTEPFQVIAKYIDDATLPPDTEPFLGRWIATSIPAATHPSNQGKAPKIKLNFQFDVNGTFSVSSVVSVERYEVEVEEEVKIEIKPEESTKDMDVDSGAEKENSEKNPTLPKEENVDPPKEENVDPPKEENVDLPKEENVDLPKEENVDQPKDENMNQPQTENSDKTNDQDLKDETNNDGEKKDDKSKEEKVPEKVEPKYRFEKIKKMVGKKNKIEIPVKEENIVQMDEASIQIWRKEELTMIAKDLEIQETNELRNSLEGYVLEMRGKLQGELSSYIYDEPREKFINDLNQMEFWLEEDGYDAEKAAYAERLKTLRTIGDPVERRYNEAKRRPQSIRTFNRAIAESKAMALSKDKKYDHIPKEEKEKAMKKCKETEEWLTEELKKQDPLSLADDPIIQCDTIERRTKDNKKYCASIMNKPKPKPKKEKKKREKKKKKKMRKMKKINPQKMIRNQVVKRNQFPKQRNQI